MVASLRRRLAEEIGDDSVERYFDGQTRMRLGDHQLEVTVASGLLAKLLDSKYGVSIRRAACDLVGNGQPVEVQFRVDRGPFAAPGGGATGIIAGEGGLSPAPAPAQVRLPRAKPVGNHFASRYIFETFLVGKSNRLGHAAAVRSAEQDGYIAPVFLHSPCGMGKTHLLQAAVHRFAQLRPDAHVRYTTGEAFTNEFVVAIKNNRVDAFRKSYRRVDLLAIDDVHFFSNKEATQAELLHTFDAVGLDGARIILASDEHPREIRKLSERLVSRFLAGVVVKIEAPDRDLRERLVRMLAGKRGLVLEDAAIAIIVDRTERAIGSLSGFGGSVRELEGLLNQIDAVHRLIPELTSERGVIGALLVRKALGLGTEEGDQSGAAKSQRPRRPIAGEVVLGEVCKALRVEVSDIHAKGRHTRVVLARSLTSYLCRTLTTLSFPEIARIMGRENHSTVITAFRRFERQMAEGQSPEEALSGALAGMTLREISESLAKMIAKAAY